MKNRKPDEPVFMFLGMFARRRGALVLLVALGIMASISETLGISLAVTLLTFAMSGEALPLKSGPLAQVHAQFAALFGNSPLLLGAVVFGLVVFKSVCNLVYTLTSSSLKQSISHDVRVNIHEKFMDLPYERIASRDKGDLVQILTAENWAVADTLFTATRVAVNISAVVIYGCFLFAISWKLTVIAVLGASLILLSMKLLTKPAEILSDQMVAQSATMSDQILADIQGMRTIRAFNLQKTRKAAFEGTSHRLMHLYQKIDRMFGSIGSINEIAYFSFLAILIIASGILSIGLPSVLAAVLLLYRLQPSIRELDNNRLALIGYFASLSLVRPFLSQAGDDRPPPKTSAGPSFESGITFKKVSFTFSGKTNPTLTDVTCTIPFGGLTILDGPSGSGKSTIINMLLRLYTPDCGEICVDGIPLAEISRDAWLGNVALAGQDADLIAGTIRENLLLFDRSADDKDIAEIASICGIDDFVSSLPEGFDTKVGDRGLNLSGGQRQRLGLARALLRNPHLLILDEALSAIEANLEKEIYERVAARLRGRTILLITHKPDAVPKPDHVVKLSRSQVPTEAPSGQCDRAETAGVPNQARG